MSGCKWHRSTQRTSPRTLRASPKTWCTYISESGTGCRVSSTICTDWVTRAIRESSGYGVGRLKKELPTSPGFIGHPALMQRVVYVSKVPGTSTGAEQLPSPTDSAGRMRSACRVVDCLDVGMFVDGSASTRLIVNLGMFVCQG
jgi:hypothetical protein